MLRGLETSLDAVSGTVEVRAPLPGTRSTLWTALTTEVLAHWLGRPDGSPQRMGARFTLAHDARTTSTHRVTRWRPQRLLGWSWEFPGEDGSSVSFRLSAVAADRTVLSLQHRGLADVLSYGAGWQLHLDRLAGHLTGTPRDAATFWAEHAALVAELRTAGARERIDSPGDGTEPDVHG